MTTKKLAKRKPARSPVPPEAKLNLKLPPKLIPVFSGSADVRGAYGGRGSAKTRTFALMTAYWAAKWAAKGVSGIVLCCRQYMNSLDDSSMPEIKMAIESDPWLRSQFEIGEKFIRTKSSLPGRVDFKFAGLEKSIDSIKSKARILLCWVDEAETVVEEAWYVLLPTIREEGSELWVTWNPKSKRSATNKRFRETDDPDFKIAEMNWQDNPFFPEKLNRQRIRDFNNIPQQYRHIWEGDYATFVEGAYYARDLLIAKDSGRITSLVRDELMPVRTYWDIGFSDATAIWVVQFIKDKVRVIDHYEAVRQPLSQHLTWMKDQGYANAEIVLPHDGSRSDAITGIRFEDHILNAGFQVRTIPNQGKGAALKRVEATRNMFPHIWFDGEKCEAGLECLGAYHERYDEKRMTGLGPEHDWSSHSSDAFGLIAVDYDGPVEIDSDDDKDPHREAYYRNKNYEDSWMTM